MKFLQITVIMVLALSYSYKSFSQTDSIFDQGIYRTYIVHKPADYSPASSYPLVLNLHGLNSNAAGQQNYSQFDNIADTAKCIVVYPNAVNGSWNVNGTSDVTFLTNLIDSLKNDFSLNSCLFVTGMSMGGFMTYKLSCALSTQITAIAVVSGNMSNALQNNCAAASGLPVMHFHGTSDNFVNYNGTFGIAPVETTINWWVAKNNCSGTPVITPVNDSNLADSCNAVNYYYGNGTNNSEVSFYKINNGGHTWPGATPIPIFGNTNQDMNASVLIWNFFRKYCTPVIYWNGNISDAWENPQNWNGNQLPGANSIVIIPSPVTRYPKININTEIKKLELKPGSTITIASGKQLKLNGW